MANTFILWYRNPIAGTAAFEATVPVVIFPFFLLYAEGIFIGESPKYLIPFLSFWGKTIVADVPFFKFALNAAFPFACLLCSITYS